MGALGEEQGHAGGWCTSVMQWLLWLFLGLGLLLLLGTRLKNIARGIKNKSLLVINY
jgi:hypothetical protein